MHEPWPIPLRTHVSRTMPISGATFQSTEGVRYRADRNGTLRKIDAGTRLTKAQKKAQRRARTAAALASARV